MESSVLRQHGRRSGSGKRVGVLTFHRCINYGSYWQARCLLDGLASRGYDAVLLDHSSPRTTTAERRVALRPTLPTPVSRVDRQQYAIKVRTFEREFERLPKSIPFDIDYPKLADAFDTIVIGSDEVWNFRHPWFAGKSIFFGAGLPADRVVAYAASFGNYSAWDGIGSPWTDLLSSFDEISVRDENSWWMLKNALGREFEIVLDPCLQFRMSPEGPWLGPEEPFALVYGHNFRPGFAAEVRRWADAHRLLLLSIGYRNDWADIQWLSAGPHDYAMAVSKAEGVATNFFHGCVFAIREGKPFACDVSPYRSIKVRGLMELVGGQAHRITGDDENNRIGDLLSSPIVPAILDRISDLRAVSDRYLSTVLEGDGR